jgi:NAD(P)-dependent dehydrogenase (short-subunit alcohol dehydrogenase family)
MIGDNSVWLITGSSSGLGRALAEKVLERGYRAVVTARKADTLRDLVARYSDSAIAAALDVTRPEQISAAVKAAYHRFGHIDVLVNNAGYGYIGAIEEGEDADIRAQFDTNVHGVIAMLQAVLPGMRQRRMGHIVNVSSIGGLTTFPNVGFYHASKDALEGLSETLAKEVAPFGIGVTVVEPGAFERISVAAPCGSPGYGWRRLPRRWASNAMHCSNRMGSSTTIRPRARLRSSRRQRRKNRRCTYCLVWMRSIWPANSLPPSQRISTNGRCLRAVPNLMKRVR